MPAPADNSTPTGALHLAPTSDASFMATDLAKSGLTVADVAGLGWHNTPDGYAIPFRDPGSGETLKTPKGKAFARTRVAKPGTGPKYLSPTGSTPFPYVLPAVHAALVADPCTPVVLTEGEKKAVRATLAGFPTIGLSGIDCWSEGKGSSTLHKLLSRYVATGRLFVMIYDSDGTLPAKAKNFDRSAGRFASAVERLGARFRRAFVPSGPDGAKQGLDDYLQAGATVDDLRRLVSDSLPVGESRKEVELPGGSTSNLDCAREVAKAVGPREELFIRGGEVVALSGGSGATVFHPLSTAAATSELERFVRFVTMDKEGEFHQKPLPESDARIILAAPEFSRRMPHIRHLCDYQQPCLDKAGKIVLPRPGYDAELQTYTNPGGPELERFATVTDAGEALWEIMEGFCYDQPERAPGLFKASAMAYMLTVHCRRLIEPERCPIFFADANRPGVGKDFLLGLPVVLTTGALPEFHAPAKDADESRKRIFAVARSGARFYIVSNCKGHLDDPSLEASATSPMLSDRILGASTAVALPNTAIYGLSGNGLTYTEDLARRCVRIRLAYFGEEVETRKFSKSDLYGHVMQHRGRYLGAMQAMVEHWQAKGCPPGSRSKASFVRWAAVVGGILESAGTLNPIGMDETTTAPTEEVQHLRRLLVVWNERYGAVEVEASKARELATANDLFGWWGDLNDRQGQIKFGKMLSRNEGRSFGGWKVQKRAAGQCHIYWRCMRAEA